jgi:hypothetical protein
VEKKCRITGGIKATRIVHAVAAVAVTLETEYLARKRLAAQDEADRDRGFHFDGLTVEHRGLIAPLFDCVQRCLYEQRMAGDDLQFADLAVGVDHRT